MSCRRITKCRKGEAMKAGIIRKAIPIAVIFIGVIIGAVPICGMLINQNTCETIIDDYDSTVNNMPYSEIEKAKESARLYNDTGKPSYYNALGINDVIGYIDIPDIDVYLPIYEGTDEKTLESGIGHLEKTSLPIGGKGTHCVLTGHSGLTTKTLFSNLDKLEIGDKFYLNTLDEKLCYEVFNTVTAEPADATKYIKQDSENDLVTLVTCTPVGINTHRLLVQGKRVYEEEAVKETVAVSSEEQNTSIPSGQTDNSEYSLSPFLLLLFVFPAAAIAFVFICFLKRRKNNIPK